MLLCSGKIYYDVAAAKEKNGTNDAAVLRIEQLYPFPANELMNALDTYPNAAEVVWVQEEPENSGAWRTLAPQIRALLRALQPQQIPGQVRADMLTDAPPTRTVVLIDEVDKAPRDFPNDLLNVLDQHTFYVAEADRTVSRGAQAPPIVVITSNSERRLPEPFLRRCIFHHIDFTDDKGYVLNEILQKLCMFALLLIGASIAAIKSLAAP